MASDAVNNDYAFTGDALPLWYTPYGFFPAAFQPSPDRRVAPVRRASRRIGETLWTDRDRVFLNAQALRYYRRAYTCVPICLVDFEKTEVDPLTHEAVKPVWQQPLFIPAQVQWSPAQDVLTRFKIERAQDVLVTFPDIVLHACGIEPPELLYGAVMILVVGDQKEPVQYTALSVHQEPRMAWSPFGDVLEVGVTGERRVHLSHETENDIPIEWYTGFTGDYP